MRTVLDTNILIRALTRIGSPARECLRRLRVHPHALILSVPILNELDDVLGRPRIRRWSQLPPNEVREFLSTLIDVAELYEVATTSQPLSRDPDDDFIIQTAIQGRAEVICTKDNDLLASEVVEFLAPRGIRVLTAVELLRELRPDPT